MAYTTLVDTETVAQHLDDSNWALLDCRFLLSDPAAGRLRYLESHIPGAVYADLDQDLSATIIPGQTGRHPLPEAAVFAATVGRWGIDEAVQVVAYDDAGGMIAGRVWWMLRWLGHENVAVLNGDWRAWQREDRPVATGNEERPPRSFTPHIRSEMIISAEEIMAQLGRPGLRLLDARARDRFRGENETLDPKGGHIPGARPAPYTENLDEQGYFQPPEALRARFEGLTQEAEGQAVALYCGSGVTAAHNYLAMVHAGLAAPRLYPGSWSEWLTDPARPVATGDEDA